MNIFIWIGIFAALLWAIILLLNRFYDFEAHGISLGPGNIVWRTKRGLGLLDRISNSGRRFWKIFGILGAVVGIALMFFMVINLAANAFYLFSIESQTASSSGVQIVLPGVTIPFIAGIVGIATVLLVHEPAHGVILRYLGMKTKSTGLLLFLIIPGAFVEEDEDEFEEAPVSNRIQVAGAGPFANIIFGTLCLGLVLAFVVPLSGIFVSGVSENTPAMEAGLSQGMHLREIDGLQITDYEVFDNYMEDTYPGQTVTVHTDENSYSVTLEEHPTENKGYIGIYLVESVSRTNFSNPLFTSYVMFQEVRGHPVINQYAYDSRIPWFLIIVLKWMFVLNIGIGAFNLLPLKPLDGGHIIEGIAEKGSSKSTAKNVARIFSVFTLAIILMNFIPSFV